MLPEKVKDRAAIILSGMMTSDAPDKQTKVRAAVEYARLLESTVDETVSDEFRNGGPDNALRSNR